MSRTTAMMSMRFEIPALSGRRTMSVPESVTADLTFRATTSGGSRTRTVPCSVPPVFDIFRSGAWRSMIRAPTSGIRPSGMTKVSPYLALNRWAMSRVSSMCWRWSSPTGTSSVS